MEDRLLAAITTIKTELKSEIEAVRAEIRSTKEEFKKDLQELNLKVEDDIKKCKDELQEEIKQLREDVERLEFHQRKYNLLIYGAKAKQGEEMAALRQICRDKLELELEEEAFVNVHKVGEEGIIARFKSWKDRQAVLTNAKKLAGTNIGIRTDLPTRVAAKRTLLLNKRKELKKAGKIVRVVERNRDVFLQIKQKPEGKWETLE